MNKDELITHLSVVSGVTKTDTKKVIDSLMEEVPKVLKTGNQVALKGFGTFKPVQRAEKTARNIQTGAKIVVPAHTAMVFKFSKTV